VLISNTLLQPKEIKPNWKKTKEYFKKNEAEKSIKERKKEKVSFLFPLIIALL